MSLTLRILIGMFAGVVVGSLIAVIQPEIQPAEHLAEESWVRLYLVDGLFYVGGKLFINSLMLLVVPLVFVSIVCGVSNLADGASVGRLGGKAVGLYLLTTAIAVSVALCAALVIEPGSGVNMPTQSEYGVKDAPSLRDVIVNIFPTNPVAAMAEGRMLQIIVFALLFGYALTLAGAAGARIKGLFEDLNVVLMELITFLISFAPYGIFFLLASLFSRIGWTEVLSLAAYFFTVAGVLLFHVAVVYPALLLLLSGRSPLLFFRKMRTAMMVAFSTSSSSATLPVTLRTVEKRLGVQNEVASFTVPLGATINMDGTAIMQGVATVFIAQFYAVDLSVADLGMVVLTATMASVGTAGVPGVGLIMLATVLAQVNLPVEGIALIIGVDRLLDMLRTSVNVCGDGMVTTVVAGSEGLIDESVFADPHAGVVDDEPLAESATGQSSAQ